MTTKKQNLTIPFKEYKEPYLALRQTVFELKDDDGKGGGVDLNLGSDSLTMTWNGRTATVRCLDILRAWVTRFDPKEAALFPQDKE